MAASAAVAQAFAKDYSKVVGMTEDLTSIRQYLDHIRLCFIGLTGLAYALAVFHIVFRYCDSRRRAATYDLHRQAQQRYLAEDPENGLIDRYDGPSVVSNLPEWAFGNTGATLTTALSQQVPMSGPGPPPKPKLSTYTKPPGKDGERDTKGAYYSKKMSREEEESLSLITSSSIMAPRETVINSTSSQFSANNDRDDLRQRNRRNDSVDSEGNYYSDNPAFVSQHQPGYTPVGPNIRRPTSFVSTLPPLAEGNTSEELNSWSNDRGRNEPPGTAEDPTIVSAGSGRYDQPPSTTSHAEAPSYSQVPVHTSASSEDYRTSSMPPAQDDYSSTASTSRRHYDSPSKSVHPSNDGYSLGSQQEQSGMSRRPPGIAAGLVRPAQPVSSSEFVTQPIGNYSPIKAMLGSQEGGSLHNSLERRRGSGTYIA